MRRRDVPSWITGVAIVATGLLGACELGQQAVPVEIAFLEQPNASVTSMQNLGGVQVAFLDSKGLVVASVIQRVDISLVSSDTAAHLTGFTNQLAVDGVSTFADLKVDKAGTGYRLRATAPALDTIMSEAFTIVMGGPTHLRYSVAPQAVKAGVTMATITVIVTDAGGNQITTSTPSITISISNGTISGTLTKTAVAGTVSFSDLSIPQAGTYTLTAAASGFVAAQSNPFVVSP